MGEWPLPFAETVVVLETESNKDMERPEKLENIDEESFVNANYIKSALKEETGLMIATRGPKLD